MSDNGEEPRDECETGPDPVMTALPDMHNTCKRLYSSVVKSSSSFRGEPTQFQTGLQALGEVRQSLSDSVRHTEGLDENLKLTPQASPDADVSIPLVQNELVNAYTFGIPNECVGDRIIRTNKQNWEETDNFWMGNER